MKTEKIMVLSVLSALISITLMALSLTLSSCGNPINGGPGAYSGYRVVFHTGEGQGVAPYPQTVAPGNIIELPGQENMTHPNRKVLSGWKSNSGTTYNPYYRYTVNGNVEFTAQWTASTSTFTVSFSVNGGNGTSPSQQSVQAGNSISLPSGSSLSRSGYTFDGWNTNSSGTGNSYLAGSSFTPTGNITLYAKWVTNNPGPVTPTNPVSYTVTFSPNGGSGTAPSYQTVPAGSAVTMPGGSGLSRSGYTFGGWNTNTSGTGTNYSAGASFTPTGNITLYAKWDAVTTTATVNSVTVSPSTVTVYKGQTQQFNAIVSGSNNPAQTVTWTVTGGGSGTSINSSGILTVAANESAASLSVKATSTADTSKSGTATATVLVPVPIVYEIIVNPVAVTVVRGKTQQFTATVSGANNPAQTVTWTVTGGGSGTSINSSGILTVAANESATSLIVRATSTANTSISGTANVTVSHLAVPSAPTNVSATAVSYESITVTWSAVAGEVAYYNVYRSTNASGPYSQVNVALPSDRTVTNYFLTASTTYYYRVSAVNNAGEGEQSSPASATTFAK